MISPFVNKMGLYTKKAANENLTPTFRRNFYAFNFQIRLKSRHFRISSHGGIKLCFAKEIRISGFMPFAKERHTVFVSVSPVLPPVLPPVHSPPIYLSPIPPIFRAGYSCLANVCNPRFNNSVCLRNKFPCKQFPLCKNTVFADCELKYKTPLVHSPTFPKIDERHMHSPTCPLRRSLRQHSLFNCRNIPAVFCLQTGDIFLRKF